MSKIIKFSDYYKAGEDAAFAMHNLLIDCDSRKDILIKFDKDTYHFYPDEAIEEIYNISNHGVCGYKRIAMLLKNFSGLTIDGKNSNFIFHGIITPFIIDRSKDLQIKNLSIMWDDPMLVQTTIIGTGDGYIDIEPEGESNYEISNKRIYLLGHHFREPLYDWSTIEMDVTTCGPAYLSSDDSLRISINELDASRITNNVIRLSGEIGRYPKIGNKLLLRGGKRYSPGIFIKDSENIQIENVKIFNAIGMAVIAQKSTDITLVNIRVIPNPDSGRIFSTNGDATHFVNCRGLITIKDCVFTQQMDDALNIHGIYLQVVKIISNNKLMVRLVHEEQQGVDVLAAGDKVRFIRSSCLAPNGENIVKNVDYINTERSVVTFKNPLPKDLAIMDCIENISWTADLLITNCIIKNNRARGLLISSGGKIEIVNNYISSPGAAILISGDCNYWFESGAVNDVTIENNIFENCTYVPQWGNYNIIIHPEVLQPDLSRNCFHTNINIKNNIFKTFTSGIVKAYCVDGITLENNSVNRTYYYPDHNENAEPFEYINCKNVVTVVDSEII